MGGNGTPPWQLDQQDLWRLRTDIERLRDLQTWQKVQHDKDLAQLELRIQAGEASTKAITDNINAAIRWFAIGAGAIIFKLLREGSVF